MDPNAIQEILNKMLLLEESQVTLYSALAAKAPNEELFYGLQRLAKIESDHVKAIENKLKSLFPAPEEAISNLKNALTDGGLKIFGSTVSAVQGLTGLGPLLRAGAAAEEKAMADYRQHIAQIKDFELRDMFWEHLIDEELHYFWLKKKGEQLN
ncbi:MAG: ferritin-like domain-containing protein [Clostridia bacterium]|nr:ferritin-like domain-containing protein [Clostridia bacterium]